MSKQIYIILILKQKKKAKSGKSANYSLFKVNQQTNACILSSLMELEFISKITWTSNYINFKVIFTRIFNLSVPRRTLSLFVLKCKCFYAGKNFNVSAISRLLETLVLYFLASFYVFSVSKIHISCRNFL